jgi:hypothetical protein
MIKVRKNKVRPLIESFGGIHLSAYVVNRGDLIDLKKQVEQILHEAYEWLHEALPPKSRDSLLQPIYDFSKNLNLIENKTGSIGLFRSEKLFQVMNLPFNVDLSCHVASSFHTKPLFRWMQSDPEFLLAHANQEKVDVYLGSLTSFEIIDSYYQNDQDLDTWLLQFSKKSQLPVYFFSNSNVHDIANSETVFNIRNKLKIEADSSIQSALSEYARLNSLNLTKKNIFQIAKATVQGRIKKLIVAEDFNIFGKLDSTTGGLALHPMDLDYEDDDILDDLAQKVFLAGGDVVIAKREEIPENRPLLAILDNNEESKHRIIYLENMTLPNKGISP